MLHNRRLPKLTPLDSAYTVAFAIKAQGDVDCYHWNDESYGFLPGPNHWRNPIWRIDSGNYIVEVVLTGYRLVHPVRARFRLFNNGPSLAQFGVRGPID